MYDLGCGLLGGGGLLGGSGLLGNHWSWSWGLNLRTLTLTRWTRWTGWTGWTGWTSWTGWTLNGFAATNTTINNLQEKVVETILVEASALHFILNFLTKRFHCIIYKRKIIFKLNDHRRRTAQQWDRSTRIQVHKSI
jgi:hypothetical protein